MLSDELKREIDECNQRDLVRLYLYITNKYNELKEKNPQQLSRTLYAVKNMDKMKECVVNSRKRKIEEKTSCGDVTPR
jgi:archaellum component FlaC